MIRNNLHLLIRKVFLSRRLADIIHRRSYDFVLRYDVFFKFTRTYQRQKTLIKALHDFTDKVIVARREKLLHESVSVANDEEAFGVRKKMALLDILLKSAIEGQQLTNEDIREEIDTFMFEVESSSDSNQHELKFFLTVRVTTQQTARSRLHFTTLQNTKLFSKSALMRFVS